MRFLTESAHRAARVGILAAWWRTGLLFVYLLDLVPVYLQVHDGSVVVGVGLGEPVLRVGDRAQRVPPVRDGLDAELLAAHAGPAGDDYRRERGREREAKGPPSFFRLLVLRGMF
jgi:hypothetical protein